MKFSSRLTQLRKENKWERDDLAKRLDVSYSTVAKYEKGTRQPDLDTLEKISNLFNTTTDYLLGRSDHRHLTSEQDKRAETKYPEVEKALDKLPDTVREETMSEWLAYAKIKANANKKED